MTAGTIPIDTSHGQAIILQSLQIRDFLQAVIQSQLSCGFINHVAIIVNSRTFRGKNDNFNYIGHLSSPVCPVPTRVGIGKDVYSMTIPVIRKIQRFRIRKIARITGIQQVMVKGYLKKNMG